MNYKKIIAAALISLLAPLSPLLSSRAMAQTWKMVITMSDGSRQEMATADIKDIQYVQSLPQLEDKNVDQILIKEVYNGGVMLDDGSKNFHFDKCIILYNNCPQQAVVNNLCFGFASPYNAQANNNNYGSDGLLTYQHEGIIPALNGIWYYPHSLVIEPYSQVVVNVNGAIDNTQTVTNSINYANPDYYCMYDPESGYANTSYYPTPADVIPTSHYLKAVRLGLGNAWALSVTSQRCSSSRRRISRRRHTPPMPTTNGTTAGPIWSQDWGLKCLPAGSSTAWRCSHAQSPTTA